MKSEPPPFHYVRWFSLALFVLSLGVMFYAGLLFNELAAGETRVPAEANEASLQGEGLPREVQFSLSIVVSLVLAVLGGIGYVGTVLTERLLDLR